MGDLLHLHSAHEQVQMLLPWRANGTLEPDEAAFVDAHLADCAECRDELAEEQALRQLYAATPEEQLPAAKLPPGVIDARARFWRRRIPLALALALPAGMAAAAAVVLFLAMPASAPPEGDYRLLGSESEGQAGNAIVLFSPDITERSLRAALEDAGARVVDGPTASGAYIVRVDQATRADRLARLRETAQVLLAEPIDQADGP